MICFSNTWALGAEKAIAYFFQLFDTVFKLLLQLRLLLSCRYDDSYS